MTEATPAAASPEAPRVISMAEGLERYKASKAAAAPEANPVSQAARVMGKAGAEARAKTRQAPPPEPTEETPDEGEGETTSEDDPTAQPGETLGDTATDEQPGETEAEAEGEPQEAETIDLGDGVKVTKDEVRDGFMLKADHTRKTQKLAEERKSFEDTRKQRLTELDAITSHLKQLMPQPKALSQLVEELGHVEGIRMHEMQSRFLQGLDEAAKATEKQRTKAQVEAETARDNELAENYKTEWSDPDKREAAYAALSSHALKLGARPDELRGLPAWAIKALDDSAELKAIKAGKDRITKTVAPKPRVIKPGTKASAQAGKSGAVQQGLARLKSSGNLADAVTLLRTMRKGTVR